jgi:hypothetical protein
MNTVMKKKDGKYMLEREIAVIWLTDEDIEMAGFNPHDFTQEEFQEIRDVMAENMDDNFCDQVISAVQTVKERKENDV